MGLPFMSWQSQEIWVRLITLTAIWGILALGLNVIVGFAGLLVLGFSAFYGIGAYTAAWLALHLSWPWWMTVPAAAVVTAACGWVSAAPAIRLKGDYLAIVTLGFGEIMLLVMKNWESVTNGPRGLPSIPHATIGHMDYRLFVYFGSLALVGGVAWMLSQLHRSRIGRALIAIREDEVAASAMGISIVRLKFTAFTLGTGLAGLAGAWYAHWDGFIAPELFTFIQSVWVLCMVVLGGLGSVMGSLAGAVLLTLIPEVFRDLLSGFEDYRVLVVGLALIFMMMFRPQGLIPERRSQYRWTEPS